MWYFINIFLKLFEVYLHLGLVVYKRLGPEDLGYSKAAIWFQIKKGKKRLGLSLSIENIPEYNLIPSQSFLELREIVRIIVNRLLDTHTSNYFVLWHWKGYIDS